MRIYFFQRKNTEDGTLTELYFDVEDESQAHNYFKTKRLYRYVGWSDGRFMVELKKTLAELKIEKDKNGLPIDVSEVTKNKIREAQAKELEFAKTNPDKIPPRDTRSLQYAKNRAEAVYHAKNG